MNKEECVSIGGIGKFAIEICGQCGKLKDCDLAAKSGYPEYLAKQREYLHLNGMIKGRKVGKRWANKDDLYCIYCGNKPKKCPCKDKPIDRFKIKEKKEEIFV